MQISIKTKTSILLTLSVMSGLSAHASYSIDQRSSDLEDSAPISLGSAPFTTISFSSLTEPLEPVVVKEQPSIAPLVEEANPLREGVLLRHSASAPNSPILDKIHGRKPQARTATVADLPDMYANFDQLELGEQLRVASEILESQPVLCRSRSVSDVAALRDRHARVEAPLDLAVDDDSEDDRAEGHVLDGVNLDAYKDAFSPCGLNLEMIALKQFMERERGVGESPFIDVMNLRTSKRVMRNFIMRCETLRVEMAQLQKSRMKQAKKEDRLEGLRNDLYNHLDLIASLNKGIREVTMKVMRQFGLSTEQINAIPER